MKEALITGSAGFIGRHFRRELHKRGWKTVGIDINTPSAEDCLDYFAGFDEPYDLVVHAAYHVGGRAAISGTNTNFMKNLQLDSSMFEWAVRTRQRRVLYLSSSAVYPAYMQTKSWQPPGGRQLRMQEGFVGEKHLDMPDADYGWAKLTGERLAAAARRNGLAVTVVRPFSGYGEDQSEDYPFPAIVRRAAKGDLTVWGPPGQTRDWIHVSDVVKGALAVVESKTEEPVNLCTGVGTEMGELACKIWREANANAGGVHSQGADLIDLRPTYDETKPTGVFYRVGHPGRMLLYYEPTVSLEEGIRRALKGRDGMEMV